MTTPPAAPNPYTPAPSPAAPPKNRALTALVVISITSLAIGLIVLVFTISVWGAVSPWQKTTDYSVHLGDLGDPYDSHAWISTRVSLFLTTGYAFLTVGILSGLTTLHAKSVIAGTRR